MLRFALCVCLLAIAPAMLVALSEDDDPPVRMGPGVSLPRAIHRVEPGYTPEGLSAHVEGTVVLQILIHKDGHVTCTKLVKGIGYGLDEKAREAAEQWTFVPAQKDGKPANFLAMVEVNFRTLDHRSMAPRISVPAAELTEVRPPVVLQKIDPEYSTEALARRFQGTVAVRAVIDEDGHPTEMTIPHPVGYGLDEKALVAAGKWEFRPARKDGKPVKCPITIEINFRLPETAGSH